MLTRSHYTARRYVNHADRSQYRQHMCGLCHALGDGYGLAARLLTSHEMILLNLLTSAQMETSPEVVMRRCPMNPLVKVRTNQDASSRFAAAAAVALATASVDDDIVDSGGRDAGARVLRLLLDRSHRAALAVFDRFGFDAETLKSLGARQSEAENDTAQDPAAPSAAASAALFAMTACLSNCLENEDLLATIGAHYGVYVYLADAYRDFAQDMARGEFNPLRPYGVYEGGTLYLTLAGLIWLRDRLRLVTAGIRSALKRLVLRRYHDTLTRLLLDPILGLLNALKRQIERAEARSFRQWGLAEALKAALFIMPTPTAHAGAAGLALVSVNGGESYEDDVADEDDGGSAEEKPKRKRGTVEGVSVKRKRDWLDNCDCSSADPCSSPRGSSDAYFCLSCMDLGCDSFSRDGDGGCGGCDSCDVGDCDLGGCSN